MPKFSFYAIVMRVKHIAFNKGVHMQRFWILLGIIIYFVPACSEKATAPTEAAIRHEDIEIMTPERTVQSFCELDAHGGRLWSRATETALPLLRSLVQSADEPVRDHVVIINSFRIGEVRHKTGSAEVDVFYAVTGDYAPNRTAFYRKGERITFRLTKTENGWRILAPVVKPHTYAGALIQSLHRRVQEVGDPRARSNLQKDVDLLKNRKRFSLGVQSTGL